jgi:uncharacterized membrane protein SirB2
MNLIAFSHWLSSTHLSQLIQRTHGAIAAIQVVHIICLATLVGLALNLSLRIAGRGLVAESLSSLAGRFVPAMWTCLGLLLASGSLLIIAEPFRTIRNPMFYTKMALLLIAIVFTVRFASLAQRPAQNPTVSRSVAAAVYMLIWAGVMIAGRFIAYR